MGREKLGEFLISKGLATPADVVRALEIQTKRSTPLGEICVQEGVLKVADVLDILNAQVESPHELFGEIAVTRGLMSEEQVTLMRHIQKLFDAPLGTILVEIGVLEKDDLDAAVEEYHAQQREVLTCPPSPSPTS